VAADQLLSRRSIGNRWGDNLSWFSKHPHWLNQESKDLSISSLYKQDFQVIDKTLVSSGVILIHKETTSYHPVLIVYPEATPYAPPKLYILQTALTHEETKRYSSLTAGEISRDIKDKARFPNRRHQNEDGSLCFIETGDLHGDKAESFRIKDILKRVREWLAGKIPRDRIVQEPARLPDPPDRARLMRGLRCTEPSNFRRRARIEVLE